MTPGSEDEIWEQTQPEHLEHVVPAVARSRATHPCRQVELVGTAGRSGDHVVATEPCTDVPTSGQTLLHAASSSCGQFASPR